MDATLLSCRYSTARCCNSTSALRRWFSALSIYAARYHQHPATNNPPCPHRIHGSISPTKVPFPTGDVNPPSNTWFTEPTGVCPQNQGQSGTSCSAFRRRQQTQPRNKRRAPEWWIVYICEQVCITYDGWNMKVLVFWLCNGFTV